MTGSKPDWQKTILRPIYYWNQGKKFPGEAAAKSESTLSHAIQQSWDLKKGDNIEGNKFKRAGSRSPPSIHLENIEVFQAKQQVI